MGDAADDAYRRAEVELEDGGAYDDEDGGPPAVLRPEIGMTTAELEARVDEWVRDG